MSEATTIPLPPGIEVRDPTGIVPPPLILLEGEEFAGKSHTAAVFTKSERVGPSFWLDLNEGAADEFGPIGNYKVIEHDGKWRTWFDQLKAIHAYAAQVAEAKLPPVVLVIDSATAEWDLLKDWISARAATSNANKRLLAEDPNAEVRIPNHLWNEANAKHRNLMRLLMTFQGIVIVTARGKEVAAIGQDGRPIEGQKKWTTETQKSLPYDATVWIRMKREEGATLIGARSLYIGVRPGKEAALALPDDWYERGLEWFVFDALRYDPANAAPRDLVPLNSTDVDDGMLSPEVAIERARAAWNDEEALKALYFQAQAEDMLSTQVPGPGGQDTTLENLLTPRIRALIAFNAQQENQDQPPAQQGAQEQSVARRALEEHADEVARASQEQRAPKPEAHAPEPEPERAPDAQPEPQARATEEPKETRQEKLARQAEEEARWQASVVNVEVDTWLEPMRTKAGEFSVAKGRKVIIDQRPLVIEALREQGNATQADAYERMGDAFPLVLSVLFGDADSKDREEQGK